MVYYLPEPGSGPQALEAEHQMAAADEEDEMAEPPAVRYELARKYELVGQPSRQGTELSLVFRQEAAAEGEDAAGGAGPSAGKKRKHGLAGYHEFHSRITLRKKRVRPPSLPLRRLAVPCHLRCHAG